MTAAVINLDAARAARSSAPPRSIVGTAVNGHVRLELPDAAYAIELTPEQWEIWLEKMPTLIATAKAQRAEMGER